MKFSDFDLPLLEVEVLEVAFWVMKFLGEVVLLRPLVCINPTNTYNTINNYINTAIEGGGFYIGDS